MNRSKQKIGFKTHKRNSDLHDKVDFATHQLKGSATAWWENYLAIHGGESPTVDEESKEEEAPEAEEQQEQAVEENVEEQLEEEAEPTRHPIPWSEFKTAFWTNFVPAVIMRMKKNEF